MTLDSPCKVNLLLNILGKRPDGFHELETVMHPVALFDKLSLEKTGVSGIELTCSEPSLPVDSRNLVYRAAALFLEKTGIQCGLRLHLEKNVPMAAGLGGGSANAATALQGLNELFERPLPQETLQELAASLGSDVPFFLQRGPGLGTGRGEKVQTLDPFPSMERAAFILVHPGFGIATAWAYQALARFPQALNGLPERAAKLIELLKGSDLTAAGKEFYNSLEAPALDKYPLLQLYQQFFRSHGADATLMSGSGSTTFAITSSVNKGEQLAEEFRSEFGPSAWLQIVPAKL